jgi:predicted HicB family RNase H-like nuclease
VVRPASVDAVAGFSLRTLLYAHNSALQGEIVDILENCAYIFGMEKKRTRGRPPKGSESQTARIYLRAEPVEKERFERAANAADVSLGEWMKDRLNRAAKRELSD